MNKCIFLGRLTKDVEIKKTTSGKSVGSFTIAVDRPFKDANGQKQADFIPCKAWERQAGFIAHYFKKGDSIVVTGELQSRNYEAQDGTKRTVLELNVAEAEFCGNNNRGSAQKAPSKPVETPVDALEDLPDALDDTDLPFEL